MTIARPSPAFTILYDQFATDQAQRALQSYNAEVPSLLRDAPAEVTDVNLLEQLAIAERVLHSFSTAFGLENSEGALLHNICQNSNRRDVAKTHHVVTMFTYLNTLLSHPVFTLLTVTSAVQMRRRPLGALRDIRWIFREDHGGLRVLSTDVVFGELTALLHQLTRSVAHNPSAITALALEDFDHYAYSADGKVLIDSMNFGTAASFAQTVVDSARRERS